MISVIPEEQYFQGRIVEISSKNIDTDYNRQSMITQILNYDVESIPYLVRFKFKVDDGIQNFSVQRLLKALQQCQNLLYLQLSDVGLRSKWLIDWSPLLGALNSLRCIDLSHNMISDIVTHHLKCALQNHPNIDAIDLSYNKLTSIKELLRIPLSILNVENNQITDSAIYEAKEAMQCYQQMYFAIYGHKQMSIHLMSNHTQAQAITTEPAQLIYLIAHRGDSQHAPENTLSAFRMAKQKGADCVEFDVMLTKDGQPIIMHDDTLDRTTNGTGLVSESTLAYIQSLDAGNWFDPYFKEERVPTLNETLTLLTNLDLHANIEIKPCGDTAIQTAKMTIEAIQYQWPESKKPPLISSFNQECLAVCLELAPEYPRAIILDKWQDNCCELATKLRCSNIHLNYMVLTKERVELIKNKGFQVYAYTVNDQLIAHQMENWGVNAIFSNNPTLLTNTDLTAEPLCSVTSAPGTYPQEFSQMTLSSDLTNTHLEIQKNDEPKPLSTAYFATFKPQKNKDNSQNSFLDESTNSLASL